MLGNDLSRAAETATVIAEELERAAADRRRARSGALTRSSSGSMPQFGRCEPVATIRAAVRIVVEVHHGSHAQDPGAPSRDKRTTSGPATVCLSGPLENASERSS